MADLDTQYVEEAPDNGDPYARQSKAWIEGVGKEAMLEFAAQIAENASSSESSAARALLAAQATATDVARTAQSAKEAKQHAETASGQVPLAQAAASQAGIQAGISKTQADRSATQADRSYNEAERAKRIVDEFNPWINQYGYSKVILLATDRYFVKADDVGKTLVFDRPATVILPASGRAAFPESFFFHVTTLNPEHRIWIDYDLAVTMSACVNSTPLIEGGVRATIQLLAAGHWRLYEKHLMPDRGTPLVLTNLSVAGQSRGMTNLRDTIDASNRLGLVKQFGRLYAWSLELLGGVTASGNYDATKVNDIPDGQLEFLYSSRTQFNGKVLFGVYGTPTLGITNFGWYWGDSGFTGNVYPVTIDGYLASDWYITGFSGEFSNGVKHAWVELTHRSLTEANGQPTKKSLMLTSTDGYSWFENRFATLNTKVAKRKILANFPFTILDTGELYLLEANGTVTRVAYGVTVGQWTETKVMDGFDEIVQLKAWVSNGDYALAMLDGGDLSLFVHSASLNKTVDNHALSNIESVIGWDGDLKRGVSLLTVERDSTLFKRHEFGVNAQYPNGTLNSFTGELPETSDSIVLLCGGVFTGDDNRLYDYLGYHLADKNITWAVINGSPLEIPWPKAYPFGFGRVTNPNGASCPSAFTSLGVFLSEEDWEDSIPPN